MKPIIGATPAEQENNLGSGPATEVLPPERDTVTPVPLAPEAPYAYAALDDQTFHATLSGFIEQAKAQCADLGLTLYYRIRPGLQDAQRRFKEHEKDASYRLDGCAGIEEYIKKIGVTPARVRKWRQRDREKQFNREVKLLVSGTTGTCPQCGKKKGHAPSCPHYERHLTETQNAVVSALVGQGYKPKDAVAMVKAAEGQDFESLFKSALTHRAGGGQANPVSDPVVIDPFEGKKKRDDEAESGDQDDEHESVEEEEPRESGLVNSTHPLPQVETKEAGDDDAADDALIEQFDPNREKPEGRPVYNIMLTVTGSKLEATLKMAQQAFGEKLLNVEKVSKTSSRAIKIRSLAAPKQLDSLMAESAKEAEIQRSKAVNSAKRLAELALGWCKQYANHVRADPKLLRIAESAQEFMNLVNGTHDRFALPVVAKVARPEGSRSHAASSVAAAAPPTKPVERTPTGQPAPETKAVTATHKKTAKAIDAPKSCAPVGWTCKWGGKDAQIIDVSYGTKEVGLNIHKGLVPWSDIRFLTDPDHPQKDVSNFFADEERKDQKA